MLQANEFSERARKGDFRHFILNGGCSRLQDLLKGGAIRRICFTFTLVELLTVVAITVILLSLLLPSLNKAKSSAWRISCQSNLRSYGIAVSGYANDYEGTLLPYYAGQNWYYSFLPYLGIDNSNWFYFIAKWPICKAAKMGVDMQTEGFTYGYSFFAGSTKNLASFPICKTSSLRNPSQRYLMMDSYNSGTATVDDISYAKYRHMGGCDMLFADSHVMWIKAEELADKWFYY